MPLVVGRAGTPEAAARSEVPADRRVLLRVVRWVRAI
jgi:hypothetical protein